ncbi:MULTISPECIES: Arc family DNA-binding protein [Delftia]|uniref:Arc family DNA-binding protein n=1 Tax=Delftia acidovorans TaxID=80866 RepID=A0A7T2VZY1_DELAC|nr:Arc family DNA-binding protein [Delftia acidovorans]QPS09656.1 Arc family DNA-binding protein [Delftia acidovorans]
MASEDVQTNLRLPADMKNRLQEAAAANNRSLSAEVTSRLSASFNTASASGDLAEFFAQEALRANESVRELKNLLRRCSQMFGLFMGYFRAKGLSLTSSEQEDLVQLQHDMSAATEGPDVKTLLLELEGLQEKVRFIDQRLAHLGSPMDPTKKAEIDALMERAEGLKKEYFKIR